MEWIKLIGILVIIVGFVLKFDSIATVVIAAFVTALVSGIPVPEFLSILGTAFVNQRFVSLFLLTLPMIGVAESYGLKQQAIKLIRSIKGLSMSMFYSLYLFIRLVMGFFAIRISGQTQFVRPLVYPIGEAALENAIEAETGNAEHLTEEEDDAVKALAAANDNFGNFFGQNTFVSTSGVLLIVGTLEELGYTVNAADIAKASLPIAGCALVIGIIYNFMMGRKIRQNHRGGDK